jgi:hypothetical protein
LIGPRAIAVAALLAFAACADLPPISAGQCGNGVVEPPETCDTFAPDGELSCRPPGTVGACRLDCRRRADGVRPACPAGWGCDTEGICLKPTGAFVPLTEIEVGAAYWLLAGDFDGDGRADVVSREPMDALGRTRMRVHFFGEDGTLDATRDFPKSSATPQVVDLTEDGRSDLVFTESRVGVLLGRADRSLVPETFSSYRFREARVRTISLLDEWLVNVPALATLTVIDGVAGVYVPDQTGLMRGMGGPQLTVEDLAGDLVTGDVIEGRESSPCRELIMAAREATSFWVVDMCTRDPLSGAVSWRAQAESSAIPLAPPAAIAGTPLVADMNGDGHLDVLVSAGNQLYVAYGDGQRLAPATPYSLPAAGQAPPENGMPLAAGDFTGDGAVDFVFENYLLLSHRAPSAPVPVYRPAHVNRAAPWTVARIADFNNDGWPDVVAASSDWLGVSFFNGSGTEVLAPFEIPTRQPVRMLDVADFDGDLVNDLALVESASAPINADTITIAFGNLAGPPLDPVPAARLGHVEQLSQFRDADFANLMVASTETVNGVKEGVLAWLEGSGDRALFAPYQLVSATEGSVFSAAALGVAVGEFAVPGRQDVLAMATAGNPSAFDDHFWLLPAPLDPTNAPTRIGGTLEGRLTPIVASGFQLRIAVAAAVADFDGNGRDEAVWAMPADQDQSCGVTFTALRPDGTLGVAAGGTMFVDEPCIGPQVATVDADGDGAADVVLLTGAPGGPDRKLFVFWNDGQGGFSASNATRIGAVADSPQQFAVLPATPATSETSTTSDRSIGFAYVTEDRAAVVTATGAPRLFGAPKVVAALQGGTGITAADVDGDGIDDLALAAAGNLRLLRAELKVP